MSLISYELLMRIMFFCRVEIKEKSCYLSTWRSKKSQELLCPRDKA
jgi:hypothetical protein